MRVGDHGAISADGTKGWYCASCNQHWPSFSDIPKKCPPDPRDSEKKS